MRQRSRKQGRTLCNDCRDCKDCSDKDDGSRCKDGSPWNDRWDLAVAVDRQPLLDITAVPCHSPGTMIGSLLALLITVVAIITGYRICSLFREHFSVWERCCAGTVVGLALLTWIGFLLSLIGGLNAVTITITVLLVAGVGGYLIVRSRESDLVEFRSALRGISWPATLSFISWSALLFWLFSRVISFDSGALLTAPLNNYGDLPFHLSAITSFAWGKNFPPTNPIYAGLPFTYPFLIDFLTALYLRVGAGFRLAFFVENFLLAISLVGTIEMLAVRLTGNRLAARLAPVIFLFNGGFGFINFFSDLSSEKGIFGTIIDLPRTYTMNGILSTRFGEVPLQWGNAFTTLLIPQRSLLFGLPLVSLIITLWWTALRDVKTEPRSRRKLLFASGVLAGSLPMLHAHSFFAIAIVSLLLIVFFWSRDWIAFLVPFCLLAAPQALFLMGTPVRSHLFKKNLGWESGTVSPVLFWLANAGPFILLLIAAIGTKTLVTSRTRRFYIAFLLWFILPNLVLLAPWPWDNIKVLILWALVSTPFVALVVADGFKRGVPWKVSSALLLLILTLSGLLDVTRALSPVEKVSLLGGDETAVAELIREKTEPNAVIAHAPIHNSAVCLTGRRSLMGYPGHLWTHGIDYSSRERDTRLIFQGGAPSKELIAKYKVDYVLVGPIERRLFPSTEMALSPEYPVVFDHAGYRLFRVKP
jgi:hypothetical protein